VQAQLLGRRYRDDGSAIFPMSEVQLAARNRVRDKIRVGDYPLEDVPCPHCGGVRSTLLSEKDMYGLPMVVSACGDCGFVYTSRRLAARSLSAFYQNDYRQLDRGVVAPQEEFFELERRKGERILQFVRDAGCADRLRDKLVVEVGCGAGGVLAAFRERGYRVLGGDLGAEYVAFGAAKGLDLVVGDTAALCAAIKERGAAVGLVIYEQVFEHLADPRGELSTIDGVLDDESLLFIGVPGLRNIEAHYDADLLRYLQIPHLMHFDLRTLTRMVESRWFSRLAGDETVRALFERRRVQPSAGAVSADEDIVRFLQRMERRRRVISLRKTPYRLFVRTGSRIRRLVERAPLPTAIKSRIAALIARVGQRVAR
jgi:SAM-dependent methyltransferase